MFFGGHQEENPGYSQPQHSYKENSLAVQQQNDIFSNITNTKGATQHYSQPETRSMSRPPTNQPFAGMIGGSRTDVPNSREQFMQSKDPSLYSESTQSRQQRRSLENVSLMVINGC